MQVKPSYHDFKEVLKPGGILRTNDGSVLVNSTLTHSLMRNLNGTSTKLGGRSQDVAPSLLYGAVFNSPQAQIDQFCMNNYGTNCAAPIVQTSRNCTAVRDFCPSGNICTRPASFINSDGNMPFGDYGGDGMTGALINYPSVVAFNAPMAMTLTPTGTVLMADTGNNVIREMNLTTGTINTVIGTGSNQDSGDGGPAKNAGIYHPRGLAFDTYGNLYISTESGRIRKVDSSGNISTFAGLPAGSGGLVSEEAPADKIAFNKPLGMVYDSDNNFLYVADTGSHRVFRIDIANNVATNIAGNGQCAANADDSVPAVSTSLCSPTYVGLDSNKNVIVLDSGHNRIRRINFSYSVNGALAFAPTNKDLSTLSRNEDKTWVRKYRDGSTSYFDAEGNQTSHVTRLGLTTSFAHNSDGTLDSVTDSVGQVTRYNYSGGKLSSIQDPAGRSTYFKYSGLNLSEINFPDGSGRKFNYDDNGFLTAEMDITSTRKIQYGYNEYHRLSSVIDPLGHITTLTDSQSLALGSELNSVGFNNSSIRTKITDSKNATVELINDLSGYVVKSKDAKGNVTTIERDFDGKPIKIIKPNGSITELTYDAQTGDLLTSTETTLGITQTKTYDSYGNLLTLKDGKGNTGTNTYNDKGLITSQVKVGGAQEEFSYNSLGLVTTQTLHPTVSRTLVFSREYDSKGNIIKATDASGRFITYSYDLAGNPLSETRQLASGTATILYEYDAFNRLTKVTNPNGDITTYQYYATGELASQTDAKGQITSYQYDASGNLISKVDPLGATRTFNYDELGNLVREVDPKGQIQTYSYDVMSKLVQVNRNDDVIQYGYNTEGELIEAKNSVSHIVFQRDVLGRVTLVNQSGSGTLSSYPSLSLAFGYDANGNRTSLSSSAVSLSYGYNSANRQTSVQSSLAGTYTFGYNNAGMLTAIQRPGGRTDISYFDNALTNSIIHSSGGSTNSFAQYNYDNRNLVIEKRAPASVVSYGYDGNGQLTSASSESFGYDPIGNRIVDNNGSYSYDSTGQRLEQDYAYTYSYDLNGNLTHKMPKDSSKEAYQFTYSSANQLVQVKVMDGALGQIKTQVDYAYDALGRRMQKSVWVSDAQTDPKKTYTRKYQYDGDNVLLEYNGANQVLAHYAYSQKSPDDILGAAITSAGVNAGLASSAGVYQYLKDALGSVSDVTDSSGNIVQRYQYSAFGKITAITDASGNDIASTPAINTSYLFTGREWDQEAGIYYYRARYYDANSGRFLQQDPHPGMTSSPLTTVNKYAYAVNSPSMFTDPSGKFAWFAIIAIGAIIGAAIGYIDYTRNGGDMWTKIGRGALGGALFAVAALISPEAALLSGIMTVAGAASQKGDFWENLNRELPSSGAKAIIGAYIVTGIGEAIATPIIGPVFQALSVISLYGGAGLTAIGLHNQACDPETGGLYRSDLCSISRGINGN